MCRFAVGEETFRTSGFEGFVAVVSLTSLPEPDDPQPATKIAKRASGMT
jgi:hypothetical protein